MSTTCDLNVDWNKCPNCVRLKERIKDAEEASCAASANLDRAYAEYREDVAAGRASICGGSCTSRRSRAMWTPLRY